MNGSRSEVTSSCGPAPASRSPSAAGVSTTCGPRYGPSSACWPAGCDPFIVPAMGSHGGATAAGQMEVFAGLGITAESVGAPIRATMDVVGLGEPWRHAAVSRPPCRLVRRHSGRQPGQAPHRLRRPARQRPFEDAVHRPRQQPGRRPAAPRRCRPRPRTGRARGRCRRSCSGRRCSSEWPSWRTSTTAACEVRLIAANDIEPEELALQEAARGLLPGSSHRRHRPSRSRRDGQGHKRSGPGPERDRPFARPLAGQAGKSPHHADLRPGPNAGIGGKCVRSRLHRRHHSARLIEKVDLEVTAVNAITACFPEDMRLPLTLRHRPRGHCRRAGHIAALHARRPSPGAHRQHPRPRAPCGVRGLPGRVEGPDRMLSSTLEGSLWGSTRTPD